MYASRVAFPLGFGRHGCVHACVMTIMRASMSMRLELYSQDRDWMYHVEEPINVSFYGSPVSSDATSSHA